MFRSMETGSPEFQSWMTKYDLEDLQPVVYLQARRSRITG